MADRRLWKHGVIGVAVAALLSGCAGPWHYTSRGALMGAAIGGGAGYLIGARTKDPRLTAGIGAGIGAIAGGVIGAALDGVAGAARAAAEQKAEVPATPQAPSASTTTPPAPVQVPGVYAGDPTTGVFVNETPWRIQVHVDAQPGLQNGTPLDLEPGKQQPALLDVGPHRIAADAWVQTQFGPRRAGRHEETLVVDVRRTGWVIRFQPETFR